MAETGQIEGKVKHNSGLKRPPATRSQPSTLASNVDTQRLTFKYPFLCQARLLELSFSEKCPMDNDLYIYCIYKPHPIWPDNMNLLNSNWYV